MCVDNKRSTGNARGDYRPKKFAYVSIQPEAPRHRHRGAQCS